MATERITIDARGLKCPLPVLKLEKAASELGAGAEILVLTTDAMAKVDIPLYCRQNGHAYTVETKGNVIEIDVRLGAAA